MKLDLQVSKRTFASLLAEHGSLEIPDFQRPYEWRAEHWDDLWNDLTENLDQDYLMGGIVLCGTDGDADLVIDGQQRLSTMTVLIAACRDYLWLECRTEKARDAAKEFHKNYIVSGGVVAESNDPYLVLSEVDRVWFAKRIQVSPASEEEFAPPELDKVSYKLPSSNRLLWRAYKTFYTQLRSRHSAPAYASNDAKVADVIRITRQIALKTWFILTRVPDDNQAYTLFEVLNDRGLELSISDLIKNVVLARASQVQSLQKAKDSWGDIADALDYENIASFIRYYWMSKQGEKITEKELFPKLKKEIKEMSGPALVAYLAKMADEAEAYSEIIGRAKSTHDIRIELAYMTSYGFRVGNTLLLAIWAATEDKAVRLEALRDVKNFLVKFAIFANQPTNKLEGVMAELAAGVRKNLNSGLKAMKTRFKKELPSRDVIENGFLVLEPSIAVGRTLLIEIETHLTGTEKLPSGPDKLNVEHIFPQSPSDEWKSTIDVDEDEFESYVGRLGNMTLLDHKLNKQGSNKSYSTKHKETYSKSDICITKKLPKGITWTGEVIKKRQKEFYQMAKEIWNIT